MRVFRHPSLKMAALGLAMVFAALALAALSGCAAVTGHPLYPDTFGVQVRTTNRTEIQGINLGLTWKLKPRKVIVED